MTPNKTTLQRLDAAAIRLRLTSQERSIADAYMREYNARGGHDRGILLATAAAAGIVRKTRNVESQEVFRAIQRPHVKAYMLELGKLAESIVARRTGVVVMETAEILERLSNMARGEQPTKVVRERRRPQPKAVTQEGQLATIEPEYERPEYDMRGALRDLGEILGLYKQEAPPPPPSGTHEIWHAFLSQLPKEQLLELHRRMFSLGLGPGTPPEGSNGSNGNH